MGMLGRKMVGEYITDLDMTKYLNYVDVVSSVAPHWYIRHGARDRDTAFSVSINLATKLQNSGKDVSFKLPWNRPHSGDDFAWSFAGFIIYIFLLTHNNIKHHHQHETYGEADGAEIAVLAA